MSLDVEVLIELLGRLLLPSSTDEKGIYSNRLVVKLFNYLHSILVRVEIGISKLRTIVLDNEDTLNLSVLLQISLQVISGPFRREVLDVAVGPLLVAVLVLIDFNVKRIATLNNHLAIELFNGLLGVLWVDVLDVAVAKALVGLEIHRNLAGEDFSALGEKLMKILAAIGLGNVLDKQVSLSSVTASGVGLLPHNTALLTINNSIIQLGNSVSS